MRTRHLDADASAEDLYAWQSALETVAHSTGSESQRSRAAMHLADVQEILLGSDSTKLRESFYLQMELYKSLLFRSQPEAARQALSEADQACEAWLAALPKSESGSSAERLEALCRWGVVKFYGGHHQEAIALLGQVVQDPYAAVAPRALAESKLCLVWCKHCAGQSLPEETESSLTAVMADPHLTEGEIMVAYGLLSTMAEFRGDELGAYRYRLETEKVTENVHPLRVAAIQRLKEMDAQDPALKAAAEAAEPSAAWQALASSDRIGTDAKGRNYIKNRFANTPDSFADTPSE